ncbi:hypothetical protein Hanom_Chr05g00393571 [Helianthus anomalus]
MDTFTPSRHLARPQAIQVPRSRQRKPNVEATETALVDSVKNLFFMSKTRNCFPTLEFYDAQNNMSANDSR